MAGILSSFVSHTEIGAAVLEMAAVIVADLDTGEILYASPEAELMFGYFVTELMGKNVDDLVPDGLKKVHKEHRTNFASTPKARPMGSELKLAGKSRDGGEVPISIGLFPRVMSGRRCCIAVILKR